MRWAGGGTGTSTSQTVVYANTFVPGNIVYKASGSWQLAMADSGADAEVIGVIQTAVASSFNIVYSGLIGNLSNLTDGSVYFLSDTVAGSATLVPPTALTSISKPVMIAVAAASAVVINQRGIANQGANATNRSTAVSLIFGF